MKVTVIRTTGVTVEIDVDKSKAIDQIQTLIGAKLLDTVNLRDGRVMMVDDGGYDTEPTERVATGNERIGGMRLAPGTIIHDLVTTKARKPVNVEATKLYHAVCVPGTTHQIVGDVAIVNDSDFE